MIAALEKKMGTCAPNQSQHQHCQTDISLTRAWTSAIFNGTHSPGQKSSGILCIMWCVMFINARCSCQKRRGASADKLHVKAARILPLFGLARLKQDPVNHGHGAHRVVVHSNYRSLGGIPAEMGWLQSQGSVLAPSRGRSAPWAPATECLTESPFAGPCQHSNSPAAAHTAVLIYLLQQSFQQTFIIVLKVWHRGSRNKYLGLALACRCNHIPHNHRAAMHAGILAEVSQAKHDGVCAAPGSLRWLQS